MKTKICNIVNTKSQTALDVDADYQTVIGNPVNESDTQIWAIERVLVDRHTIRNIKTNNYLAPDGSSSDGRPIAVSEKPFEWEIFPDVNFPGSMRFCTSFTMLVIELADEGNETPGTPVKLVTNTAKVHQTWRVLPIRD